MQKYDSYASSAAIHAELPHSNSFMFSVWEAWPGCGIGSARSENLGALIQAPHCQGHGHRAGTEATIAYQTFTVWKLHETVQAGRARRTYTIHNPGRNACAFVIRHGNSCMGSATRPDISRMASDARRQGSCYPQVRNALRALRGSRIH